MTERLKKSRVFLLPVLLSLALLGVMAWGITQNQKAVSYERHLSGLYTKSFDELVLNMGALETDLSKMMVAASPRQYTLLLSDIWHTTGQSTSVLGQIPTSYGDYSELNRFLVQAGDYCQQLTKQVTRGLPLTQQDMQQIASMQGCAAKLTAKLREAQEGQTPAFVALAAAGDYYGGEDANTTLSFSETETEDKYPTLIYDGPFSDSTEQVQAKGLGSEQYDENSAMAKAKEYLGDELASELTRIEDENGRIPAFGYTGKTKDNLELTIFITKQGGKCLWMSINPENTLQDVPSPDAATLKTISDTGRAYLEAKGFGKFEPTYAQYYNGYVVINYAALQNDIILYNDLIKVWIDQNSFRVTGLDTRGYLYCHVTRNIPAPEITPEEAQMEISESLEVKSVKLVVIPLNTQDERLCYEFKCNFGGDEYIVYVNAVSGMEEQIFKIINSESGQLVL